MNMNVNGMIVAIPESVENLQLPNPDLLTYYKDEKDRVLWIEGEIGDGLFELSKMILRYNMEDKDIPVEERKPIKIFINSPGGDLDSTLAFIGMINISIPIVTTISNSVQYAL